MGLAIARRRLDSAAMSGQTDKHCISFRPMTAQTSLPDRKPRGPNAERRAATREKIMAAAVRRLYERGYAGATTPEIAKAAGVARGSLLHQFPTKVDLILAVAEYAAAKQGEFLRAHKMTTGSNRDQFVGSIDRLWAALRQPEGIALIEIMLATRHEPDLAEHYARFARAYERSLARGLRKLAERTGLEATEAVERQARFTLTALRGLAVETMFGGDPQAGEQSVALLKSYRAAFFDAAEARAKSKAPAV